MQREIILFLNFAFQTDSCREGSWSIQDLQPFALSSRHLSLDKLTWTGFFPLEGSWKKHLPFCSVPEWPEGLTVVRRLRVWVVFFFSLWGFPAVCPPSGEWLQQWAAGWPQAAGGERAGDLPHPSSPHRAEALPKTLPELGRQPAGRKDGQWLEQLGREPCVLAPRNMSVLLI